MNVAIIFTASVRYFLYVICRPYILDPANPFNNVAKQFADTWEDVSRLAHASLQSPALQDVDESNWC